MELCHLFLSCFHSKLLACIRPITSRLVYLKSLTVGQRRNVRHQSRRWCHAINESPQVKSLVLWWVVLLLWQSMLFIDLSPTLTYTNIKLLTSVQDERETSFSVSFPCFHCLLFVSVEIKYDCETDLVCFVIFRIIITLFSTNFKGRHKALCHRGTFMEI